MTVTLAHGSGGRASQRLIQELMLSHFDDPELARLEDCAVLPMPAGDGSLAFTTDGFVVDPPEFPGGDIGKLAVCGSVNDLAVRGAVPRYLSLSLILEEGLDMSTLERIVRSAGETARAAQVAIVAGDTKVVPRGAADRVFITTSGIGIVPPGRELGIARARVGDAVIVSGDIGRHGAAIVAAREDLRLSAPILSDCGLLGALAQAALASGADIRCMRDATRGGLATVLNEIAQACGHAIRLEEDAVPIDPVVRGLAEMLGLDPLYLACEGRLVAVVPHDSSATVLAAMRAQPMGQSAAIVGRVVAGQGGRVSMATGFGGERIVDMLAGEQLPRIC